jgi:hypothetical protein
MLDCRIEMILRIRHVAMVIVAELDFRPVDRAASTQA